MAPSRRIFASQSVAEAQGADLGEVIHAWCDFDGWLVFDNDPPDGAFNIRVEAGRDAAWGKLQPVLEKVLHIRFIGGTEPTEVLLIERDPAKPLAMTRTESHSSSWGTGQTAGGFGYKLKAADSEDLVKIVSKYVEPPVLDESGLEGVYQSVRGLDHRTPGAL